jgi:hydroxymethylpyrimidine kinase/phosphomethylpyrimidine kinase
MNRMACSLFKRREGFQEIERSRVTLDMVNEGLNRNTSSFEKQVPGAEDACQGTVTTPNLHEAGALLGREIKTLEQMKEAAHAIRALGPENVVVKGGHLEGVAADLLFDGHDFTEYRAERINSKNNHGSGCVFASAIAAGSDSTYRRVSAKDQL